MTDKRYEIKFVVKKTQLPLILEWLYFNTSAKESYPERTVNSIYFDDENFTSVSDNLIGISKRSKYRVRWYGDYNLDSTTQLIFEVKSRSNRLGSKDKIYIESSRDIFSYGDMRDKVNSLDLDKKNISYLNPTLHVSYLRNYYEGSKDIRITIDEKIQYSLPQHGSAILQNNPLSYPNNIVEIKFNPERHDIVSASLKRLHLVPTRHSKYITGISMFNQAVYL